MPGQGTPLVHEFMHHVFSWYQERMSPLNSKHVERVCEIFLEDGEDLDLWCSETELKIGKKKSWKLLKAKWDHILNTFGFLVQCELLGLKTFACVDIKPVISYGNASFKKIFEVKFFLYLISIFHISCSKAL